MHNTANIIGQRFGRLIAQCYVPGKALPDGTRQHGVYDCICDCGNHKRVITGNLRSGATVSCGCLQKEAVQAACTKHGEARRGQRSRLHMVWAGIIARCRQTTHKSFDYYGGRGIRVCDRWASDYAAFKRELGDAPSESHTVDRINVDGHYSCGACAECAANGWPMNIQWATRAEQTNNRRNTVRLSHEGWSMLIGEWAAEYGIPSDLIRRRLKNGMSVKKALTLPYRKHTAKGRYRTNRDMMRAIWRGMIARCHNEKCKEFKWYGAKGVAVCQNWRDSFDAFLADVGPRPSSKHSLDRYPDPTGNYEPGNVRWATRLQQARNKRPEHTKPVRTLPRHIV